MSIKFFVAALMLITVFSCIKQQGYNNNISIDERVRSEAEKYAKDVVPADETVNPRAYENTIFLEFVEDNKVRIDNLENGKPMLLNSYHYSAQDTITIIGEYGAFGGIGYHIKITNNKAFVDYLVTQGGNAQYALDRQGEFKNNLKIPCEFNLKLSKMPTAEQGELIYGFIELETPNYYKKRFGETYVGEVKTKMKVYFKSYILN